MYIAADKYLAYKAKQNKNMSGDYMEMKPVDLNYAYVAFDKDAKDNLEKAHECNLNRFGLTEDGC